MSIKKVSTLIIFMILIIAPLLMYSFNIFPYLYSYQQVEEGVLINQGILGNDSSMIETEEVSEELQQVMVTNDIDSLRNTALSIMTIASVFIGLSIISWSSKPNFFKWWVIGNSVVLIILIISYVNQVQSITQRIVSIS